jgi:4-amino-4-deoxy-L-arabinose transferase-like glycosyltransferase
VTRRAAVFTAVAIAIAALFLGSISTSNPPGFHRDESDIAFNAATIAASGRDEHGARFPLYFSSMGDWKSAPYIYLLAGVFTISGPSEPAARALSAVLGLLAVALLGVLGFRLTRRPSIAVATAALAAATPWIFEVTRLVFEVALEPLLIAALLVAVANARARPTWSLARSAGIGLILASIAYTYAGGRVLAPLLAVALAVFATRQRWRSIVVTWGVLALALVPMAIFSLRHPHALFARYDQLSATRGEGFVEAVGTIAVNIVHAGSLWQWTVFGDRLPQEHVQGGGGCLLLAGVILAGAGVVVVARRRRWDAFWAFVVLGAFASIVPAALTTSHPHALRAIGIPVFLVALAIPAFERLGDWMREPRGRATAAAIVVLGLAQFAFFETVYWKDGPHRVDAFDASFPGVFRKAIAVGRPIVLLRRDWIALEDGEWYGRLWRAPVEIVDRTPPHASVVVTTWNVCPSCRVIAEAGIFRAYVSAD